MHMCANTLEIIIHVAERLDIALHVQSYQAIYIAPFIDILTQYQFSIAIAKTRMTINLYLSIVS